MIELFFLLIAIAYARHRYWVIEWHDAVWNRGYWYAINHNGLNENYLMWGIEENAASTKWHFWQGVTAAILFATLIFNIYFPPTLIDIFLSAIVGWITFDISLNLFRGKKWYYLGSNFLDSFGWWNWGAKGALLIIGLIIKFAI